ncbi:MAG: 16S rRNA (adenine(1518)-N(6)/adenine(1519)-N(6))-dimethyltransferase RsmA [Candidatus Paceibacterota bacterium]|jgi:16S rRNA (adenine1518-N6/adenine1519-N6)-dimethyltransferase
MTVDKNKTKTSFLSEDIKPQKSLGQNFLLGQEILNEIVDLAEVKTSDTVLEIGPGTGSLTKELAKNASKVIAVEKDEKLIFVLKEELKNYKNIEIICSDIREWLNSDNLKIQEPYKLVANLPYYLSSFIIRRFLEIKQKPEMIVLTLQKELVERICEREGRMSLISIMVNLYGKPQLGPIITRDKFYPAPQVDSRVLIIKDIKKPENIDEKYFFRILRIGFSSKRKKLLSNLKNGTRLSKEKLKEIFNDLFISDMVRAQELSLDQWKKLSAKIKT